MTYRQIVQGQIDDITNMGFIHQVFRVSDQWSKPDVRNDELIDWINSRSLGFNVDYTSDVVGYESIDDSYEFKLVEIWAFKDPNTAMLFKLTWC